MLNMGHRASFHQPAAAGAFDDAQRELAEIEAALARNPQDCDALMRAARWGERAGLDENAARFYAHAAEAGPLRSDAHSALAAALRRLSRHDEALPMLQAAIERMPDQPELWLSIARLMMDLGDDENAETFYSEALRLAPNHQGARLERADLLRSRGKLEASLADYDHLLLLNSRDGRAIIERADVELLMGRCDQARIGYLESLPFITNQGAAVERLKRLAITEFSKNLSRADLRLYSQVAPVSKPAHFVFFHVDAGTHGLSQVAGTDYHALLARTVAVARRHADARITVLTDRHTKFDPSLGIDELVRDDVNTAQLMYERMRLQRAYIARVGGANVIFLDTDVLINRDPSDLFDGSFDIGLLWRTDFPDSPFLGGAILACANAAALRFYDLALEAYHELESFPAVQVRHPDGIRRWWGDQYALAAVVDWGRFARRTSDRIQVEGTTIRFLAEREYCRVPSSKAPADLIDLRRPYLLHFKGNRKGALEKMATRLLA